MSFPASFPGAIVYPAHSSNTLGPPCVGKVIVLHTPEETADAYAGTPVYFAQPGKSASTHAFASYLGFLFEMVPPEVAPIANGVLGKPYPAGTNPGQSLNRQSRSIEIEGRAASIGQTMPRGSAQWNVTVRWIAYWCVRDGIPADRQHIIGHYKVANNRRDPGTLNIGWIVEDVRKLLGEEDDMTKIVSDGGFYYAVSGGTRVFLGEKDAAGTVINTGAAAAAALRVLGAEDASLDSAALYAIPALEDKISRAVKKAMQQGAGRGDNDY